MNVCVCVCVCLCVCVPSVSVYLMLDSSVPAQDMPSTETIDEYRPGVLEVLGITEMASSA